MLDYSRITSQLLIGVTPKPGDYLHLYEQGVRLVINMRLERRPYRLAEALPLHFLWLPSFDSPLFPIPVRLLERGVHSALAAIEAGSQVYVHCAAGAHRGVAMGAAILIGLGSTAIDSMKLIKERRGAADPYIWYIRSQILKFEQRWSKRGN